MNITKAIIPSAGYGTRMSPATNVIHKELFTILNKPIIHYLVDEAIEAGIKDILIIINERKLEIKDYIESITSFKKSANFHYLMQENHNGLGGAIKLACSFFCKGDYFLVMLPDNLLFSKKHTNPTTNMINIWKKNHSPFINVCIASKKEISLRASLKVIQIEKDLFEIKAIVEKPREDNYPSLYTIGGRYILDYEIFDYLKKVELDNNNEIQLSPALAQYIANNKLYGCLFNGERYDTGSNLGYAQSFIAHCLSTKLLTIENINELNQKITKHNNV